MERLIDITTLRLGNILSYNGQLHYVSMLSLDIDDEYNELIGITPLGKRSGEKSEWIRAFGYDLKPVPVTEEWLLKYEFDKSEAYDFGIKMNKVPLYTKVDFNIILSDGVYWYTTRVYDGGTSDPFQPFIEIFGIHELQNIFFSLNRTELIINNKGPLAMN